MFPCLAKFLEHSTLNSVQSTIQRMPFMDLNTLGRNLLNWALSRNIKFCMSLKIIYINWICVLKIFSIQENLIFLFGVLRRAAIVLRVKPLFSLRRQMKSFFLDENQLLGQFLHSPLLGNLSVCFSSS